ncbi:sel1 repeat family protein [Legionella israelensis]|uniref:Uncharacterized protein n=1 Tax=Legionella israelensis TaxID=454 RepID=A0A0W0VPE5_9GAMM|nr:sel1 repeat family protein [Legionella israelensis]KTD21995.1 hypothetical protein Lisr_1520 [Legionella israelensis]QBS08739.1 sel1 repeat family protein [Legionella israelensis]SCY55093.1 hypothetical protein SAMN02746069_02831 [Legionella israelensis DSM 19235]STX58414.1 Uncharacterised protein [Legionella israelensis]
MKIIYTIAGILLLSTLFNSSNVVKSDKNVHKKAHITKIKQQTISSKNKNETEPKKSEQQCESDEMALKVFQKSLGETLKEHKETSSKETNKNMENELKRNLRKELLTNKSIKKIVIKNNWCGAYSAWRLSNLYKLAELHEDAQKYHYKLVQLANSGNVTAIGNLCTSDNTYITKNEKIRYCNLTLKSEDKEASAPYRFEAMMFLSKYYFDIEDGNKLIKICEEIDEKSKNICFFGITDSAMRLAEKLYSKQKYGEAYQLYQKIEPYDKKGWAFSQATLGDMFLYGKGQQIDYSSAIFWYKKALEKPYNDEIKSTIFNSIGIAYSKKKDYVSAFRNYENAAVLG